MARSAIPSHTKEGRSSTANDCFQLYNGTMPSVGMQAYLLMVLGMAVATNGRLFTTEDTLDRSTGAQTTTPSFRDRYLHSSWKDAPSYSSDKAAMEFNPSSDANYYFPKKLKGHGINVFSAMGWLRDGCPGDRTSEEKEHLLKGCARWSTGLEHEGLLVHSHDGHKEEHVVNVGTVAMQMSRYGRVFGLSREDHSVAVFLEHTGVEFSGRSCAGVNEVNFRGMAESVSMDHQQLTFDSAFCQLETLDAKIVDVVSASPGEAAVSESLGEVRHARSGMSSQLGLYTRTGGKTHTCSSCDGCDLKDYTGSYHVSISLPHDPAGWILYDEAALKDSATCAEDYVRESGSAGETARSVWVDAHMNFANMVQWVEPLLLAVMGASDSEAVCDDNEFVEGSYRTMSSGWGVPGTTDVRTFGTTGTGRYSQHGFDWLLEVAPPSASGIFGCTAEGMGSDIRTKSSVDEHFMAPGTPLPPMDVGFGVEIRIFDNFPLENLKSAYRIIALLADNSRVHHADEYIYGDHGWKVSAQEAMKEGWNAIVGPEYVRSLEVNLNVDLSGLNGNTQAFEVLSELYAQLYDLHSDGLWTGLLLDNLSFGGPADGPTLHNPNRDSWESAALDAGLGPARIREILGLDGGDSTATVQLAELVGTSCDGDIEDVVYLAETLGLVETIELNADGSVAAVQLYAAADDEPIPTRICKVDA